jgi:hypothetical protein
MILPKRSMTSTKDARGQSYYSRPRAAQADGGHSELGVNAGFVIKDLLANDHLRLRPRVPLRPQSVTGESVKFREQVGARRRTGTRRLSLNDPGVLTSRIFT